MTIQLRRVVSILLLLATGLGANTLAEGNIYHQVSTGAVAQEPLTLEAVVEAEGAAVVSAGIYYRVRGQSTYLEAAMSSAGGNLYFGTIPATDITEAGLEYYLIAILDDESVLAFPVDEPEVNPIFVPVRAVSEGMVVEGDFEEFTSEQDEADVLILSPEPLQFYLPEDVVVGVSLFNVQDLDESTIRLVVDGQDVTTQAVVSVDLVTYSPANLRSGAHQVELYMNRTSGAAYAPVAWRFLVTEKASITAERAFKYSGSVVPAYTWNQVDAEELTVRNLKMNFRGGWDWMTIRGNAKVTSEEDPFKQPRNRFTASFQTPLLNLGIGDVTPRFGRFGLDGKRLRGYDANLTLNFFNLRVAQGEVERVIQGRPSMAYADPGYEFIDSTATHELYLSRAGYTFRRNILAIRPSFGSGQKGQLAFTIIKAKDDVTSVNRLVDNGLVEIPSELGNHIAFQNEDWYGTTATHDTMIVGTDTTITPISRHIGMDQLLALGDQYGDLYVDLQDKDWTGGKSPQDNLVIGSSLSLAFNNRRTVLQSGFALSMLNKNIWDPVLTPAGLDTLAPGDELDGKIIGQIDTSAFDPRDVEDWFHINLNQIPLIPVAIDSATLANPLKLISKMPSLAYHATAKLNYMNNFITLEYQQVGPEFNSLANPNLQRNVRIRTISDRIRLFRNKLFITALYRSTDDNIIRLEDDPITRTATINLSANINPGPGLPSFAIGRRTYERNNGIETPDTTIIAATEIGGEDEISIRDRRESSQTEAITLSLSYRLQLLASVHDLNLSMASTTISDEVSDRIEGAEFFSPAAQSNIISLAAKSRFSQRLETNVVVGTNRAEIGASDNVIIQEIFNLDVSARVVLLGNKLILRGGFSLTSSETNQDENPLAPFPFVRYGIKGGTGVNLVENLRFVTDFKFQTKQEKLDGETISRPNSRVTARLEYTF